MLSVARDMTIRMIEGWLSEGCELPSRRSGFTLLGLPLCDGWPDQELAEAVQLMLAQQHAEPRTCQTQMWRGDGQRCFRYRLTPLQERSDTEDIRSSITGISVIATDITDMLEAEEQLRSAELERSRLVACEAAVQEASRLKTEHFTHISHEIRTPVAGIISIAELLLADVSLQPEHQVLVSQALRSGEILLELVGMVLDLRKIESGELELQHAVFRTADLIRDAQLLSVLVKRKVPLLSACQTPTDRSGYFPSVRRLLANCV